MLFVIFLFGLIFYLSTRKENFTNYGLISSTDAKTLIKQNKIDFIIDVRTTREWEASRHPQAIHIPFGEIQNFDWSEYEDKRILLYCQTGRRAKIAWEEIHQIVPQSYYITSTYESLLD